MIDKVKLMGTIVKGTPLYADGKIYLGTTSGWHCMKPTADGVEFVQKLRMDAKTTSRLTRRLARQDLSARPSARLYCLGKKDAKPAASPIPAATAEEKPGSPPTTSRRKCKSCRMKCCSLPGRSSNSTCGSITSADSSSKRGTPISRSAAPVGKIDKSGLYEAPAANAHVATMVTAKVGDATGQARVRVVPPLPWKFDFQSIPLKENPITKVNEGQPAPYLDRPGLSPRHPRTRRPESHGQGQHDPQGNSQPRLDGP